MAMKLSFKVKGANITIPIGSPKKIKEEISDTINQAKAEANQIKENSKKFIMNSYYFLFIIR